MQSHFNVGACAATQNPFRPAKAPVRQPYAAGSAEAEVRRLKAELAKVRAELRELAFVTQHLVRSML